MFRDKVAKGEIVRHDDSKRPIPRIGYSLVCKLGRSSTRSPWVWVYVTALWEHLSRLGSIGELNYLFMGHSGDHVWTSFNTDKTHTEGEDAGYKRAFFHNPELPGSNFYFSLACHIFLTDRVAADGPPIIKVFSGKKTSKSFEKWLSRAFKTLTSDEQAVLGVLAELLGTHSFRKGGMTDAGGAIEGVPVTAVELRASHTLGGSKDPYYHATTNGDAAVGRYLAGLGWCFDTLSPCATRTLPSSWWRNLSSRVVPDPTLVRSIPRGVSCHRPPCSTRCASSTYGRW
jgi:hypothetical protein